MTGAIPEVVAKKDEHRLVGDGDGREHERDPGLTRDTERDGGTEEERCPDESSLTLRQPVPCLRSGDKGPHHDQAERRSDAEHDRRNDRVCGAEAPVRQSGDAEQLERETEGEIDDDHVLPACLRVL